MPKWRWRRSGHKGTRLFLLLLQAYMLTAASSSSWTPLKFHFVQRRSGIPVISATQFERIVSYPRHPRQQQRSHGGPPPPTRGLRYIPANVGSSDNYVLNAAPTSASKSRRPVSVGGGGDPFKKRPFRHVKHVLPFSASHNNDAILLTSGSAPVVFQVKLLCSIMSTPLCFH